MSESGPEAGPEPGYGIPDGRLDPESRWTISACLGRTGLLTVFSLCPWVTGALPLHRAVTALVVWLAASAIVSGCVAVAKREKLGGPSLNHWDECLAGHALALLGHAVLLLNG